MFVGATCPSVQRYINSRTPGLDAAPHSPNTKTTNIMMHVNSKSINFSIIMHVYIRFVVDLSGFQSRFKRVSSPSEVIRTPRITAVYQARTKLRCLVSCIEAANCVMFSTDGGECAITELVPASSPTEFQVYSNWYMLDI